MYAWEEISQNEAQRDKKMETKERLRDTTDTVRWSE